MRANRVLVAAWLACILADNTASCQAPGPVRITLDEAIRMALRHNHNLRAARTMIQQNQGDEISANLRPNPELGAGWAYIPLYKPEEGFATYLHSSTEIDIGLNYLIERGQKRQRRYQAAKNATDVTRSQVADMERSVTFDVASLFIDVQLADSTLELAQQNLKSFENTVGIGENQFKGGSISENDYLKIKLQLLQFQTDVQQAQLSRVQALANLRQLLGYESVPRDYEVAGVFEYQPLPVKLDELQALALKNRPDLRAARQGVTLASSQYVLAKANGKQDLNIGANYAHNGGYNTVTIGVSIPLAMFNRNQGEIAKTRYAITQAEELQIAARGQVLTDVTNAHEALRNNERVVQFYRSGYIEIARKGREISEYAYRRGAATLLDFLDAERSYRATQLSFRQTLAAYLLTLEQVRQAVGTRSLN